jgi:hypothetical protein
LRNDVQFVHQHIQQLTKHGPALKWR